VQPRLHNWYNAGVPRADQWVLLAYRLRREPSTPRIALWRKLKRLGVVQLLDGLVALPLDSRNREQLEWIADEVVELGGEASVWIATPGGAAQARALATALQEVVAGEYRAVIGQARAAAAAKPGGHHRRTLARLRRELGRIRRRDYFPPPQREEARRAVQALAERLDEAAA
jgi:Protein ChrB, N-terminal